MHPDIHAHRLLILDFGSQYTQLIARRVREHGVYSEVHPWDMSDEDIAAFNPKWRDFVGQPGVGALRRRTARVAHWCSNWACRFSAFVTACRQWQQNSAERWKHHPIANLATQKSQPERFDIAGGAERR